MSEKVAIYCRLSEEDKDKASVTDESGSIRNQRTMLSDYAQAQGWEIYRVYSDDDYNGSDRSRPEFNRLIADARLHRFDIILCKTQSRFTRELELVERYIHGLFPLWGIRFVSIVDNADTANKGNKKSRQINGLVNEWYLEDMSESIKSALDSRRKNGFHIGSFALYGYKKDPDLRGHLVIDEEAATVVREVFRLFAQGYGKTAIARILNERGVPNPTEYKRRQGLRFKLPPGKTGTLWKYSAISDMLRNECYIGNLVQGKYESISYKTSVNRPRPSDRWFRAEGTHEPIIDRPLWDRVQALLAERTRPFKVGTVGLFAGKARCAECGYLLRSCVSGGRRFLCCPSRYFSKSSCAGAFISERRLEGEVLRELGRLNAEFLDTGALLRAFHAKFDLDGWIKEAEEGIAESRRGIERCRGCLRELYLDKLGGIISQRDFIELSQDFTSQRERLEKAIEGQEARLCRMRSDAEARGGVPDALHGILSADNLCRTQVDILIEKITVGRRVLGTRCVPIEIYWRF